MCAAARNKRDCLLLLMLAAILVQPIYCTNVLVDNPMLADEELAALLWTEMDDRHASTSKHDQDFLYKERLLRGTGNVFTATSSPSCQEECTSSQSNTNAPRCVKLCTCLRQKRCNKKSTRSKRNRCKSTCTADVDAAYETINDYNCFRTVKGTNDTMIRLAQDFPDLVTIMDIGYSYRVQDPIPGETGYTIRLVKITSNTAISQGISEKAKVFLVGGVHAREYAPPEILLRFAEKLAEGYGKDADISWILDHTEIYVLPIANPDGRQIAETNRQLFWRKNRHLSGCGKSAKEGVDINRNFPFKYGGANADANPCSEQFRGSKELSEVESQAIFDFAELIFPKGQKVRGVTVAEVDKNVDKACGVDVTGVYIDLHSYGNLIFYPWAWAKNKKSPDDVELQTMARKMASFGKYGLWGPGQPEFLYPVAGDTTDTMYALHCVASFGLEVGNAFYQKCDMFEADVFPNNYDKLIYAAKVASAPFKIPKGPDVLSIEIIANTPSSVNVTVLVSDEKRSIAYGKAFAATGRQDIAMVRLFVDDHPYNKTTQNTGTLMNPLDADGFNSPTESASLEVDTTSLLPGQHVVYIEAEDSGGFKGPISAVFLNV